MFFRFLGLILGNMSRYYFHHISEKRVDLWPGIYGNHLNESKAEEEKY